MPKIVIQKLPLLEKITTEQFSSLSSKELVNSNFLFLKVAAEINNEIEEALAQHNLSSGRYTLLSLLQVNQKGLPPTMLAAELGVKQATISGLLNNLEKDRLITRNKNQVDARSFSINITPQGVQLLSTVVPLISPIIQKYWGKLTSDEHHLLSGLLTTIHDKMKI